MPVKIMLGVCRRLDNRFEGLNDDSPRALELHNRRKAALHDVLDHAQNMEVLQWGMTDDSQSHEYVEIDILAHPDTLSTQPISPSMKYLNSKLIENGIEKDSANAVAWMITKLRPKQEAREIKDYQITLADGTWISCDPPDESVEIKMQLALGPIRSFPIVDVLTRNQLSIQKMKSPGNIEIGESPPKFGWAMAKPPQASMEEFGRSPTAPMLEIGYNIEASAKSVKQLRTQSPAPKPIDRYVNLWFSREQADEPRLNKELTLVKGQSVFLRIQIAPYDERTLLVEARPFPSQTILGKAFRETKNKPIPLEVTLFNNDFEINNSERTQKLTLVRGQPTETRYFRVKPIKSGRAQMRVCVFYRNHMLQSLIISTCVAEQENQADKPQQANIDMTFSSDFKGAKELHARGLWLGINENSAGTHILSIKDSNKALSRDLSDTIEKAVKDARKALRDVAFVTIDGKQVYRFDNDNRPSSADAIRRFREDLTNLAIAGQGLYESVLGTGQLPSEEDKATLQPIIDDVKRLSRSEQIIQIVRFKFKDIWPWAIMYDGPMVEKDNVKDVCLAFRGEDGHSLPYSEGIKKCKHRGPDGLSLDKTIVCPYDFWGFKHIIEQPARHCKKEFVYDDLALKIKTGANRVFLMPVENALIQNVPTHLKKMEGMDFKTLDSFAKIINVFESPSEPHLMYFFCHGEFDERNKPYLIVGNRDKLWPKDLDDKDFRWGNNHTLVFINGCQTVGLEPSDMSTIMQPFVEAEVSGVIGTEIGVTTTLAGEFAQQFFDHLINKGEPVGQIIKDLRLDLLMKYNPLGLVYTPYCSADLQLIR